MYLRKISGFIFQCIDGLLLTVYRYTTIGDILNIQLPILSEDNDNNRDGDDNDKNGGGDDNDEINNFDIGGDNDDEINNDNICEDNDESMDDNDNNGINNFVTGGSLYKKLPACVDDKRATMNPQNIRALNGPF